MWGESIDKHELNISTRAIPTHVGQTGLVPGSWEHATE